MSLAFNSHLADLPVYQPGRPIGEVARELGLPEADIIKLASNENPLGPSPKALAALQDALRDIHLYPDGNGYYLKQKLSEKFGITPANIILGNGSNDILEFVGHALLTPSAEVVVSEYCFAVYPLVTRLFAASLVTVPARNYGHDLRAMLGAITSRTRLVFAANPNNPTGTLVTRGELVEFVNEVPPHVLLVLDQAYHEFLRDPVDFLPLIRRQLQSNLLLLRTFSKIYGLAGLRVGYGIASTEVVAMLEKIRQPFNVNSLAQAAAIAALDDDEHVRRTQLNNAAGLEFLSEAFVRLGLRFIPSHANFVLVQVGAGKQVNAQLQKEGVIVRPMDGYGLPEWIRVTVGTPAQNSRFVSTLASVVSPK